MLCVNVEGVGIEGALAEGAITLIWRQSSGVDSAYGAVWSQSKSKRKLCYCGDFKMRYVVRSDMLLGLWAS